MLLKHWLKALQQEVRSKFSGRRDARSRRLFYRNAPAQTEVLEDRTLLTSFVVDTLDDVVATDGRVSLREAILAANGNSAVNEAAAGMENGDTITFSASIAGGTIVLTGGQLEITDDLQIDGQMNAITISGNDAARIFSINTAADEAVSLSNLSLTAGNTAGSTGDDGGAIFISDNENVTLDSVTITNSIAAGRGGAIFTGNGTLTLTNSQIGNEVVESDVWSSAVDETSGEQKVFAFVDDQNSSAGLGTILTVYSDDGTLAAEPVNPVVAGLDVTQNGSIFFEVEGTFDAVAPYEIYTSIVADTPVSESEPNGDSGTATGINEDALIAGSLADTSDEDFFSITLGADDDTLVVMLDNDPDGAGITDAVIDILDTNGTMVLSSSLYAGEEFDAAIADGLTGGATYFIRISSGGGTVGAYEFVAKAVDSAASPTGDRVSESEPNDNTAGADVLTAGQFGQGSLDLAGGNQAGSGGGVFVSGGTLNLDFTAVNNNVATGASSTQGGGGIASLGGTVTIDNSSTVSFNRATGASGSGGGILASGGVLTILDSSITSNTAARAGGGLETQSAISTLTATITNANFSNNVAGSNPGNGGGLHVTSPTGSNATSITITGGNFSANTAAAEGGGIWNDVTGTITINGVNINNNTAGGAAANEGGGGVFNNGGRIIIQNNLTTATSISGNIANGAAGSGGGILNDGGTLAITGATITGNSAVRAGGGIEVTTTASRNSIATLTNVTISSNTAGNGGGVHATDAAGGNTSIFTIRGGSVTANIAATEGGGLWNDIGGTMMIRGVGITGNTASGASAGEGGGGVFNNGGTVNIRNFATTVTNISNNVANGAVGSGGGILNDGGTLQIQGAVIDSNSAVVAGGGIAITTAGGRDSDVTLSTTTISGNTAQSGAGVHTTDAAGTNLSELSIIGGLIAGNSAASEGGGLWNDVGGAVLIGGTTISGNTASGASADQGGGGIFNNGGSVSIGNFFSLALGTTFISDNVANGAAGSGGGILNDGGTLEIDGAVIDGNSAVRAGGGIEVTTMNSRNSIVEVTNSSISNNVVGSNPGNGGGVHITDAVGGNTSTFTITDSDVIGNSAAAEGGGLWNAAGGTMNIDGVLILDNTASGNSADQGGGGIFNDGGTVNITNTSGATQILANFANGAAGSGGGILNDGGTLNITGAMINSNAAVRAGGGIEATTANARDSVMTLTNTVISMNEVAGNPGNGGGVHISDAAAGNTSTFTMTGGFVTNNSAAAEGGGLWNDAGGTMTINGVNIGSNTASGASADQGGGGVFNNGGTVIIQSNTTTATTIAGNVADGAAGSGGGILNDGGTLTITGALITGNSAVRAGGGIEATTTNSRNSVVTVTDSTISNNTVGSSPGNGGGVHITDLAGGNTSNFTLTGGTVTGNSAASEGGGLWNAAGGTMIVDGTTISGNTASGSTTNNGGGGIFNDGGMLTVTGATIMGNIANGARGNGGGFFNEAGGTLTITETTINNNSVQGTTTTGGTGGGIFNLGTLNIMDSTLAANSVNNAGGGIWNSGTLDAIQVTISGNTAATNGGGIFAGGSGSVDILNSTVTNNRASAGTGGGIANGGTANVFLESTIVAENLQATSTPSDINGAVLAASRFNLVGISTGLTGITNGTNNNLVGTPANPIDPLLGPLADNGGPTFTHKPLPGSPAVNAGSNPDDLEFDQRGDGFDRTIGPQTDIGSVEAQINLLVVGSGLGDSRVRIYDSSTGELITTISPYGTGFAGAIRTAVADVNGDGSLDLITGAGPGGGPHVKVFSGADNFTTELFSFFAFNAGFLGGVYVAAANFNPLEDDNADLVVSADAGAGPHVIVFNGTNLSARQSFFAYSGGFTGGVRIATGDISGDGIPDIITAAGPGAGPHVRVFDGASSQFTVTPLDISQTLMNPAGSFFAYGGFAGGVFVASGDIDGDGRDDIITGAGAKAGPHVKVFSGMDGTELFSFFAFDPNFVGGVTVGSVQGPDGDGIDDIVVGAGPDGGPVVRIFSKDSIPNSILDFFAFDEDFIGGIFVSGASSGPSLLTSPLLFGGGPIAGNADLLSQAQLDTLVVAAIQRLETSGGSSSAIEALAAVDVRVSDLAEGVLGLSLGGTILIDADASGAGWFIDPTPGDDAEFDANLNALDPATVGRVDLLTVLLHEFGHELGSDDLGILEHPENLMAESLTTGKRRLPNQDLDAFFSDRDLLETSLS